jgi:hypothetical protein
LDDGRQWKIFPNPIDERLNITREGSTDDAIFILYDALGRVEKQFSLSSAETSFDVSDLVTGWYSFQLISRNGTLIGSGTLVKK